MEVEDRRVRKTKRQLRTAITELLQEKDVGKITVRDVAERADVNRGTFYAHYRDVDDLLRSLQEEFMQRIDAIGAKHNARQESDTFPYLLDLFNLTKEYEDIFYWLYCRGTDAEFRNKVFSKLKYQYLYELLLLRCGGESEALDMCAGYVVSGMCSLAQAWIEGGTIQSPETMAKLGGNLVMNGIKGIQA